MSTFVIAVFVGTILVAAAMDCLNVVARRRAAYWARRRDAARAELERAKADVAETRAAIEAELRSRYADILMGPYRNRCGFCGAENVLDAGTACPSCGRIFIDIHPVNEAGCRLTAADLAVIEDLRRARGWPVDLTLIFPTRTEAS